LRLMSRALLCALVTLPPGIAAAAPDLRIVVPDGFDCPTAGQLRAAFAKRIGSAPFAVGQSSAGEASISLAQLPEGVALELRYQVRGPVTRRLLPLGQGTCADLAESIALIADGWLRELPRSAATSLAPATEAVSPAMPPSANSTTAGRQALSLRLGGGALLGSDARVGPEGTLAVDVSIFRGLGMALFFAILEDAGARQTLADGSDASVTVGRQTVALAARYAFAPESDSGPRVFAGLALEVLEPRASGYTLDRSSTEVVPAGFVAAVWQQRLWRHLRRMMEKGR